MDLDSLIADQHINHAVLWTDYVEEDDDARILDVQLVRIDANGHFHSMRGRLPMHHYPDHELTTRDILDAFAAMLNSGPIESLREPFATCAEDFLTWAPVELLEETP